MRNEEQETFIDRYIDLLTNTWGVHIDHEDGSTAPFSSLACEEVEANERKGYWFLRQ